LTSAKEYNASSVLQLEVDYKYDVYGNLIETDNVTAGSVQKYVMDGWNPALSGGTGNTNFNVLAVLNSSNNLLSRYMDGDQVDQHLGRIDVSGSSGTGYWTLIDDLGSVRDVIANSSSATVKDAITYDAFGNMTQTDSTYLGLYSWTGRLVDSETGLQYNRARWYDASTGRWISEDPSGFDAGDSNLYRYVNNAPTNATDPSGMIDFASLVPIAALEIMLELDKARAANAQRIVDLAINTSNWAEGRTLTPALASLVFLGTNVAESGLLPRAGLAPDSIYKAVNIVAGDILGLAIAKFIGDRVPISPAVFMNARLGAPAVFGPFGWFFWVSQNYSRLDSNVYQQRQAAFNALKAFSRSEPSLFPTIVSLLPAPTSAEQARRLQVIISQTETALGQRTNPQNILGKYAVSFLFEYLRPLPSSQANIVYRSTAAIESLAPNFAALLKIIRD
jgi:RHS repeat-associated protein